MVHCVKDIGDLCGIESKNVHTYISRGKLIKFRNEITIENLNSSSTNINELSNNIKVPIIKSKKKKGIESIENNETSNIYGKELKTLRIEKLSEDIKLAKLRNEKIEGKLIHTDLVQHAILEVIQRYKIASIQETEQHIRDLLNELSASNEIITKACTKNAEIANEAFSKAIFETKQAIKNSISESLYINI